MLPTEQAKQPRCFFNYGAGYNRIRNRGGFQWLSTSSARGLDVLLALACDQVDLSCPSCTYNAISSEVAVIDAWCPFG